MQGYVPVDGTPVAERGRAPTQMRQLFVKRGVNSRADGSAYLESERGKVLAAVFGPRPSPKAEFSERAELRVEVRIGLESGEPATEEERVLSAAASRAIEGAARLEKYAKSAVEVRVLVLDADGSVLAGILNAASVALADAGIEMKDVMTAVSVGVTRDGPAVDLTARDEEEASGCLTVAALGNSNTVVQMQTHPNCELAVQGMPLLVAFALEACAQLRTVCAAALKA